jgi:beta-N-acetylhexosaminidase
LAAVKTKEVVFVSLHSLSRKASDNFGVSQATIRFINTLSAQTKVVVTVFGSPYALRGLDSANCVIAAYEDNKTTQELAAQGIFGAFAMTGKLPVTASEKSKAGDGVGFKSLNRLRTAVPEEVGLSSDTLAALDKIANELVSNGTAPGCQVMVVKNGAIVYHHTFGYWTYDKTRAVDSSDIYDMASVTKVMATTPSLMTLYDAGKFDPEKTMGDYLSELKGTNKANLQIKQVMTHQAGLTAWIPFYKQTLDEKGNWKRGIYAKQPDEEFTVPVANGMYMRHNWVDEMWRQIYASEITPNPKYKYSDLGFFMFAKMVREQSGDPLDVYAQTHIYEPLGMAHTTFRPLEKFDATQILPSENDRYWRHQIVQGTVHDMGAAMLGGVSGHAGLFSTAHDVATYFQMLLNGGTYGGKRIINESTVKLFTTRAAGSSRRALGFDMKDLAADKLENLSNLVSNNCFGHTGFVGQGVWADPDKQLIFIFLSNRTFPTMENNKLKEQHYREKMQTVIYKAMK